jgi:hypothetical protein
MRPQAGNATIAVDKRVNPHQAEMRRSKAQDRVRFAEAAVNFLKTFQKARYGAGTDGDVRSDLNIPPPQFAGDNPHMFFRRLFLHPV